MLTKIKTPTSSHPILIMCLLGTLTMGLSQIAGAYSSPNPTPNANGQLCVFSVQLQNSVSVRRQYLVKLDQVLGKSTGGTGSIEQMYGNVQQAAYSPEDDGGSEAPARNGRFAFGIARKTNKVLNLDDFSIDCLGCHDGVTASAVGVTLRNDAVNRRSQVNSFTSDHPIGMHYSNYVAVDRGFKPVFGTKMIFVGGKVGCLTCHDPTNPEKGHLVMSDRESALCHTCHNK